METIGFVGLGAMGSAMAERLLDRGHRLSVFCRRAERAVPLTARGATLAASPAEVGSQARTIAVMVTDAHAVRQVLRGESGLAGALGPSHVLVNLGTVGAEGARSLAKEVRATGASYVDAPVLGSVGPARSGELLVFVGARDADLEPARPLLQALAKTIFHLGDVGQASAAKLVCNMLLARYVSALGEVMALAEAFRLEPKQLIEIFQSSALASPMWDKAKSLSQEKVPLHFALRHMVKDLRLLDEEVDAAGLSLPAHEATYAAFQEALQAGLGDRDYSELALFIGQRASRRPAGRSE